MMTKITNIKSKYNYNALIIIIFLISKLCIASGPDGQWSFPKDHGIHKNFKIEWWYLTGHIIDTQKKKHGIQITIFRTKVKALENNSSILNHEHIYIGHVAWSDLNNNKFHHEEITARPGLTYLKSSENDLDITLQNWKLYRENKHFIIDIPAKFAKIKLKLKPAKRIIFHGNKGISYKGPEATQYSHYYSYTRLNGEASIVTKHDHIKSKDVSLWMDREIFNESVNDKQKGWDWFAIQFDNGEELMCFQVRGKNEVKDFKAGTWINKEGESKTLKSSDINFEVIKTWTSKETKITYPSHWQISIPTLNMNLKVESIIPKQELKVSSPFPMAYWEGACTVKGSHKGRAYMELVGYK
eukprot:COSAG01_NODE_52_length_31456_cov_125.226648_23_plen_356_part_00